MTKKLSLGTSDALGALRPLETQGESLAESVYETLMEAIVSGQLAADTVLSAVQLSQKLEVSRTPVQQALMLLAADGLVENASGRRARVARFTRDDLYNIFEMRRLLEGRAAELAAGRIDGRQLLPLGQMAEALANEPQAIDWQQRWTVFDEEFHKVIAACSGNPLLARDIGRYRLLHRGFNRFATDVESLQPALAEHQEILAALSAGDGPRAKAAMDAHIGHWQVVFIQRCPYGS